ncbi:hypothetical protein [Corallococcus sp. 4LFB]|uniref:hypothetical protein n=1 Tax=Corallococcus sp. 4LFB TaxID=3383249 RepID=UPI0039766FC5
MARKAQGPQDTGNPAGGRPARRKTAPRKKAGTANASEGRLELRRDIAEYRAAAEAQADVVRERINAALEVSRRTREEIEQRIASELHTPRVTAAKKGRPRRANAPAPPRASAK